jgi:uncharacterized protein YukE
MAVPKQVQAQLDAANRILEEANRSPAEPPGTTPPDLATLASEPAANAPPATPEPPQPAAPAVTPPPKQDEETWEARYKALKGMYNKQVPELQSQVNELNTKLEHALKRMDQAPATPTTQQPPAPTADPQDVEAYGEDLVNMVKRTAERMFGSAARQMHETVTRIEDRLTKLETELKGAAQTASMTAEQAFFDRLTRLVANWEEINEDDRFKAWCLEIDPTFGLPRQRGLQAAQNAMDADRVANFLRAYLSTQAPSPKPSTPSVETQVSPRAVASAPPPAPASKPMLTAAQVEQFYRDVAQGRYRGREAEQQRVEQVINEALAEGRIR